MQAQTITAWLMKVEKLKMRTPNSLNMKHKLGNFIKFIYFVIIVFHNHMSSFSYSQ
jgi:hypothetical protein